MTSWATSSTTGITWASWHQSLVSQPLQPADWRLKEHRVVLERHQTPSLAKSLILCLLRQTLKEERLTLLRVYSSGLWSLNREGIGSLCLLLLRDAVHHWSYNQFYAKIQDKMNCRPAAFTVKDNLEITYQPSIIYPPKTWNTAPTVIPNISKLCEHCKFLFFQPVHESWMRLPAGVFCSGIPLYLLYLSLSHTVSHNSCQGIWKNRLLHN